MLSTAFLLHLLKFRIFCSHPLKRLNMYTEKKQRLNQSSRKRARSNSKTFVMTIMTHLLFAKQVFFIAAFPCCLLKVAKFTASKQTKS